MDTWTNSTGDRKFLDVILHFMDADYSVKTIAVGVRVYKLTAEIRNAVEVVSRSLVKVDADKHWAVMNCLLNQQELHELKNVYNFLNPAADLTHFVGGSKYPTMSSVCLPKDP
ncbi:hypothetical protein BGZ47_007598 [Haplosporangium gracile]|nr:hypothetical protein BGZ47_007598 [Haplosporangium gracile]